MIEIAIITPSSSVKAEFYQIYLVLKDTTIINYIFITFWINLLK